MATTIGVRLSRGRNLAASLSAGGSRSLQRGHGVKGHSLFLGKSEGCAKRVPLRTLFRQKAQRGFRSAAFLDPRENRLGAPVAAAYNLHYPLAACQAAESFENGRKRTVFLLSWRSRLS